MYGGSSCLVYCKFGNFRENFIFANSLKRHICDVQISQLRRDLPIVVNDGVILLFCEGLIFTKLCMRSFAKKKLAKVPEFTVIRCTFHFHFLAIISLRKRGQTLWLLYSCLCFVCCWFICVWEGFSCYNWMFLHHFRTVSERLVQNIFQIFILQQFKVITITVHVPP